MPGHAGHKFSLAVTILLGVLLAIGLQVYWFVEVQPIVEWSSADAYLQAPLITSYILVWFVVKMM